MERIEYQVLSLTGEHDEHATVERYEHEDSNGKVVQEFWGAFLPDGRMIAIPGDLPKEHAQIVYRKACMKNAAAVN